MQLGYENTILALITAMNETDQYLKMTGQTLKELSSGGISFGWDFILQLVRQCIKENKKIIWEDLQGIDEMRYRLEKL